MMPAKGARMRVKARRVSSSRSSACATASAVRAWASSSSDTARFWRRPSWRSRSSFFCSLVARTLSSWAPSKSSSIWTKRASFATRSPSKTFSSVMRPSSWLWIRTSRRKRREPGRSYCAATGLCSAECTVTMWGDASGFFPAFFADSSSPVHPVRARSSPISAAVQSAVWTGSCARRTHLRPAQRALSISWVRTRCP